MTSFDLLEPVAMTYWQEHWPELLITTTSVTINLLASIHVLLNKSDTKASIGWIGLIWLSPFIGVTLYVLLGINRIQRKAKTLRKGRRPRRTQPEYEACPPDLLIDRLGPGGLQFLSLSRLVEQVSGWPLLAGNRFTPLMGGDETYPAMVRAIDGATRSVSLVSYIFNDDRAGQPIAEALIRAHQRGVEVRVLIDAVGTRYGWPSVVSRLTAGGVPVAKFIPTLTPGWIRYANLRNHCKVLVVDGTFGFTGGMNIMEDYYLSINPKNPKTDLHFEVRGPIIGMMQQVFAEDWSFTTGEKVEGPAWFPTLAEEGETIARCVLDGPDEDHDMLNMTLLGALACARESITIVTPYFLPDPSISSALIVAALRGVEVDVYLPEKNNHILVHWASIPGLLDFLENHVRVWFTPPPFDHSKLMIVDQIWTLIGSANWDPRSLELNFEMDVECYDRDFAAVLQPIIDAKARTARAITIDEIRNRPLPIKIRDEIARLFSPYL